MIDLDTLRSAPDFTILRGAPGCAKLPADTQRQWWELFELEGEDFPDRDNECAPEWFTEEHAALCALNEGHTLVKLPDERIGSRYYRWYVYVPEASK